MGDDDMFSSDLSDEQLKLRLGHMRHTPCQVLSNVRFLSFPLSQKSQSHYHLEPWKLKEILMNLDNAIAGIVLS